ncbi:Glutathione S-transferase zeta class [Zostera marina]|uniref:glutathione transferase n=1 Tax=Zostera marina TaxID=29655 RepID=A0A0K9NWH8_ZOSMR|nr:Glutathione S-transferase zeta class [Zostera marina]
MAAELLEKENKKLKLYSYWRSSCSHRVRIALNLKGLDYEYKAVNILKGEHLDSEFEKVNPVKFVPALTDGDLTIVDSFAIILYLEDKYPQRSLLPHHDLAKKSLNYQVASIVSSTIQPLQNLRVLNVVEQKLDAEQKLAWGKHHLEIGFMAIEKLIVDKAGYYATGDEVFMADVFLAPQLNSAINRFKIDMCPFPTLARLHEAYSECHEFQLALPEMQPDATSN